MSGESKPSTRSVLGTLSRARLLEIARSSGLRMPSSATREAAVEILAASGTLRFRELLGHLGRDELRAACKASGLPAESRSRPALMAKLLEAHGVADSIAPAALFDARSASRDVPRKDDIVRCRQRQWLVDAVQPSSRAGEATVVRLVCLDDDHQGREIEVLWELELGAAVQQPEAHGLGDPTRLDPPRWFAAYLHALKWNAVTATDPRLFQAPFRAGIKLMAHQLTPLRKALLLPRVNVFIADDVGLGKTIEAGLVMQELLLRQRVELVLVVCPPSVALQWRDEMAVRFGLRFEIYNRAFVARRRQERGFAVNPWSTHSRFIVSYQTLRRPEHRDVLLQHLGDKARKSLLVLDEAHTAAPASASKYAIDSRVTRVVRDLTSAFENRLFLSATPHNGHSNSFSALLEMLDPNRFTRGIEVSPSAREAVMVRRLKEDLRQLGHEDFPRRDLVRTALRHDGARWTAQPTTGAAIDLGEGTAAELSLASMLAEYTSLACPERGRGRLVFVNLQKRLLSSINAFHRTLGLHAAAVAEGRARSKLDLALVAASQPLASSTVEGSTVEGRERDDDDESGIDDATEDAHAWRETLESSRELSSPTGRAKQLLDDMVALASGHRALPDAKALALLDWVRRHQCPGVRGALAGALTRVVPRSDRAWTDTRVIVFTEYADTKRWLAQLLAAALDGTDDAEDRVMELSGGMADDRRAAVQEAFNSPPDEHPVRILLATDAAREGVNLQGFCADLFHFDLPWNPARLEQRNGRIDRTLQPAKVVRCHYFVYPARREDAVLDKLVEKVAVIRRELGSLGSVVMERLDAVLSRGIDARTAGEIDEAEPSRTAATAREELEVERTDLDKLRREIDDAGRILEQSRRVLEFDPPLLRDAIDVGLELAGVGRRLDRVADATDAWTLPRMPESWEETLDSLRPPRGADEMLWQWRRKPLPPVTFTPPERISDRRVHLHLSHPLVSRVMSRFLAQGFGAHDLSRVTVVRSRHDHVARAIAFGRLSLFGAGASRLHDQLVAVAAPWLEARGEGHLHPGTDLEDREALARLEALLAEHPTLDSVGPATQARLAASASSDFATLWEHVRIEADALAHDASRKLAARGRDERDALRRILETQRAGIDKTLRTRRQGELTFPGDDRDARAAREQWLNETTYLEARRASIAKDLEVEPAVVESLYEVRLRRLEPVGLVYVWPETKG